MKKNIVLFFVLLLSFNINDLEGQCQTYGYQLSTNGFTCSSNTGEICFTTVADWTAPLDECDDYIVEIEFPKGSFIYTNLGNYSVYSQENNVVKLRDENIILVYDYTYVSCLTGLLQVPNTEFTLRILNTETGHVVNGDGDGEHFYLDNEKPLGVDGEVTTVSQAIADDILLVPADAATQSQSINIHGTLIIDVDYRFSTNSTLNMAEGSKIEIDENVVFEVVGSNVYSCDNTPWVGIIVNQSSELAFYSSSIKNAETAIELKDLSTCSIMSSSFIDNNVGVGSYGENYKTINLNLYGNPWMAWTVIKGGEYGMKFENTSQVYSGYFYNYRDVETGVYAKNTDIIARFSFFDNCSKGIVVEDSPNLSRIENCGFEGTHYAIKVDGSPLCKINNNTIYGDGSGVAIRRISGGLDEVTDIENNYIHETDFGIIGNLKESRGSIFENPEIYSAYYNVVLWGLEGQQIWATQYNEDMITTKNGPFVTNVIYNNIDNGRVFNNTMYSNDNNVKIEGGTFNHVGFNDLDGDDRLGVRLNNSDLSEIYCNEIVNDGEGVVILGNNGGSDIRGNNLSLTDVGLVYGTKFQTFAHTGIQEYKANEFGTSTSDDPKAINYSPAYIAEANQYVLGNDAEAQGTNLFPYFISSYSSWFNVNNEHGDDGGCGGSSGSGSGGNSVTTVTVDKHKKVIDDDTTLVTNVKKHWGDGGVLFDAKVKTVIHILEYWELGGNMFQDVMQDQDYQEAVEVGTLQYELNNVLSTPVYSDEEVESWTEEIDAIVKEIHEFDKFSYDTITHVLESYIDNPEYQALLSDLEVLKTRYSSAIAAKKTQVDNIVSELIANCDALSRGGTESGDYYKDILSLSMQVQLSSFTGYTESEKNKINAISEKCGYEFGDVVYKARSLRAIYEDVFQYNDECEDNIEIELRGNETKSVYEVYPNPAQQNLSIVLKENTEVVFEIVNSTGAVIDQIEVNGSTNIDLSKLKNGVYFLKDKSGEFETVKFTVIK